MSLNLTWAMVSIRCLEVSDDQTAGGVDVDRFRIEDFADEGAVRAVREPDDRKTVAGIDDACRVAAAGVGTVEEAVADGPGPARIRATR
jgi:hypothetical protein